MQTQSFFNPKSHSAINMCGLFRCFQRLLENCLFFHKEVRLFIASEMCLRVNAFLIRRRKEMQKYMGCWERLAGEQGGVWGRGSRARGCRKRRKRGRRRSAGGFRKWVREKVAVRRAGGLGRGLGRGVPLGAAE